MDFQVMIVSYYPANDTWCLYVNERKYVARLFARVLTFVEESGAEHTCTHEQWSAFETAIALAIRAYQYAS
ncbi:hypothetical protein [Xanthomonas phage JGB6]|nr:hypothetical protein [Xanthomonas phage JGB6]